MINLSTVGESHPSTATPASYLLAKVLIARLIYWTAVSPAASRSVMVMMMLLLLLPIENYHFSISTRTNLKRCNDV
jgi:hypothetical protein